jgi:polyisoprenoid-binding protein YceI
MARNGVFSLVRFTPLMAPFAVVILELACSSGMALGPPSAFAQASTGTVDPGHSAAQCTLRHTVVANVSGEFVGPVGTVTFDPANLPTLKDDVAFDTMSVRTRNADRDKDLRTRPVLRRRESIRR